MYYSGKGVEKDFASAFQWMRVSAENGNYNEQNNLGVMYLQGQKDAQANVDMLAEQLSSEQRLESDALITVITDKYVVWK